MVIPLEAGPECGYLFPQYLQREMFDDRFNTPECDFYYRTDLEYRKVIDEFLWLLEAKGYTPHQKVFMTGFSAGGLQTNLLRFLHTDLIAAVAIGAPTILTYPVDSWDGTIMNYPYGTADIDSLSGMYSFELLKKIPHFLFAGANDTNIPPPSSPEDEFYQNNFGSSMASMVTIYNDYLVSIGMQSQYKLYPTGHLYWDYMIEDTFKFFESVSIQK
jgi:hypothetical protein